MLRSSIPTTEPLLEIYSPFDRQITQALQHGFHTTLTLSQKSWICYLSAAMRQGHLCVRQNKNTMIPSPEAILEGLLEKEDGSSILPLLLEALYEGATTLKRPIVGTITEHNDHNGNGGNDNNETPLVHDGERWYFRRYWNMETDVIEMVKHLAKAPPQLPCDREKVQAQLEEALRTGILEEQQAEAIKQAADQTLCWITGGPGTGKTHTAGQLIRFLYLACPEERQKQFRLILAAPTGKAATQLEASVLRAVGSLAGFPPITSQTLHRLLGLGSSMNQAPTPIHADCILIDEASMIDAQLMAMLLRAIPLGTRLLFLGDADQLPAVDVGAFFCDLLQVPSGIGSRVRLTKSRRTQCPALLHFARSVQAGNEKEILNLLYEGHEGLQYIPYRSLSEARGHILEHASTLTPSPQDDLHNSFHLSTYLQRFRLLSPLREGDLGVEGLNHLLHQRTLTQKALSYPILITRNQPDLSLWNGEMGLLHSQKGIEHCLFLQNDTVRSIPRFQVAGITLGYCVSVHKSQGSEWDTVLLVLPEGSERFGRQLLYTAATRAKKRLILLSREETVRKMVSRSAVRCSGVVERLSVTV